MGPTRSTRLPRSLKGFRELPDRLSQDFFSELDPNKSMGSNRLHQWMLTGIDSQGCSFKCDGDQGRSLATGGKQILYPTFKEGQKDDLRIYILVSHTLVPGRIME